MTIRFLFTLFFCTLVSTGCNLIYKQNIQQGNAIEQDDLDELYIGMNQRQVLFVLGTPSIKDPFRADRWDYVQTFSRRGSDMVQRTVTLRFEDGLLSEIDGQDDPFAPTSGDDNEVATFVKKPETTGDDTTDDPTGSQSGTSTSGSTASPQDAAVNAVQEEVLKGVDPDIESINERNSEDRDYQRNMDLLDQTPNDDLTSPDIDG